MNDNQLISFLYYFNRLGRTYLYLVRSELLDFEKSWISHLMTHGKSLQNPNLL